METRCSSDASASLDELAESRRDILIDRLIRWMVKWLDSRLGLLALQTHHGGAAQTSQGSFPAQQTGSEGPKYPPQKSRPGQEGDQNSDEAREDEEGGGRKHHAIVKREDDDGLEFACPYLKHNPSKYQKLRSCSSYGWKSIHRIKEHLYRRHLLPQFKCIRCCRVFQTSDTLTEHSKTEVACEVMQDEPDQDGIKQDQLAKLKSRKRGRDRDSEHDKWITAYQVLFPDDYLIPSPYFERTDTGQTRESFLTALREHVGRESPRLIRPRLEGFLDEILKESLTPQILENLLREVFTQVLNTFPRKPESPPGLPAKEPVNTDTRAPESAKPSFPQGNATDPVLQEARNVQYWPGDWPTNDEDPFLTQASHTRCQQLEETGQAEAGPSNAVPAQDGHASELDGNTSLDPQGLMALFSFDDFNAEYAAWLGQPEETSSHADSGYFSSLSGGGTHGETGNGKETAWDPSAGF